MSAAQITNDGVTTYRLTSEDMQSKDKAWLRDLAKNDGDGDATKLTVSIETLLAMPSEANRAIVFNLYDPAEKLYVLSQLSPEQAKELLSNPEVFKRLIREGLIFDSAFLCGLDKSVLAQMFTNEQFLSEVMRQGLLFKNAAGSTAGDESSPILFDLLSQETQDMVSRHPLFLKNQAEIGAVPTSSKRASIISSIDAVLNNPNSGLTQEQQTQLRDLKARLESGGRITVQDLQFLVGLTNNPEIFLAVSDSLGVEGIQALVSKLPPDQLAAFASSLGAMQGSLNLKLYQQMNAGNPDLASLENLANLSKSLARFTSNFAVAVNQLSSLTGAERKAIASNMRTATYETVFAAGGGLDAADRRDLLTTLGFDVSGLSDDQLMNTNFQGLCAQLPGLDKKLADNYLTVTAFTLTGGKNAPLPSGDGGQEAVRNYVSDLSEHMLSLVDSAAWSVTSLAVIESPKVDPATLPFTIAETLGSNRLSLLDGFTAKAAKLGGDAKQAWDEVISAATKEKTTIADSIRNAMLDILEVLRNLYANVR